MNDEILPVAQYTKSISQVPRKDLWGLGNLAVYDEGDFTIRKAHEMVHEDPTLATAWAILRGTLLSHMGGYHNENPKIEEFVVDTLAVTKGWGQSQRALLTAPLYGFSVVEEVWMADGTQWVYDQLKPIHPTTIDKGFELDKNGDLLSVRQRIGFGEPGPPIFVNKLIVWSFGDDFGQLPQGISLLRPAYRHYHSVDALLKLWNSCMEMGPRPLIAWPVGPGELYCPIHEIMEPAGQVIEELAANITDRSLIAYTAGDNGGTQKPEVLANEHIRPEDFLSAIRFHNGEMLKAMLVPRLLVEEAEFGTRAQAQVQYYGPFIENVRGIQAQVGPIIIDQLVRRLIEVNFGEQDDYGEWQFDVIDTRDEEMLASVLERLVRSGIELTEADHKKLRGVFDEVLDSEPGPITPSAGGTGLPNY